MGGRRYPTADDVSSQAMLPPAWADNAACNARNGMWFFAPDGERTRDRRDREAIAVAICHECTVIGPCRQYAVETGQTSGVWGGLSEERLVAILRARAAETADARYSRRVARLAEHREPVPAGVA